jgi:hypothetical protein
MLRTLHKINALSHTHKTQLKFSPMYFKLEYIGCWSQLRNDRFFPAQKITKVNGKLLSLYQYMYLVSDSRCGRSNLSRHTVRGADLAFGADEGGGVLFLHSFCTLSISYTTSWLRKATIWIFTAVKTWYLPVHQVLLRQVSCSSDTQLEIMSTRGIVWVSCIRVRNFLTTPANSGFSSTGLI